jgi:hypothetical protein
MSTVKFEAANSIIFSTANGSGGDTRIPQSFLPFGSNHGDLTAPVHDDGSTDEITLGTDVIIFGSRHNRLYVSQHDMISHDIVDLVSVCV